MNNPSFLERAAAALLRWAEEQHRLAEDEKYWQAAQHDPRLMADITCALARGQAEPTVLPSTRWEHSWSALSPLMAARDALSH